MVKNTFSTSWKGSTQVRKQRKYRHNAPLHLKQKMNHVHLNAELRKKYGTRNILVKKGDKIKVLRGQFAKREGKVDRVNLKDDKVFVNGIEAIKKDGTKQLLPLSPSNLMITELELSDKKRKLKLEGKTNPKVEENKNNDTKVKVEEKQK
jgi:large subunit ribosomal protein L24